MSLVTYQEIWNLLNEYQFDIDILSHSDLVCLICSKVMKNACQTICGCKFCLKCIEQYLSGEEKCCPRQIDDCKEQIINFQRDVMIDNATNRKISQIQIKCPESFCQYTVELSKMQPHIKSHQIKCPYSDIGCNQPKLSENKLIDHLNSENAFHTTLLLDSIQNLKNEIGILHDKVNHKENLIEILKNENFHLKNEVELLKTENIEIYLIKKNLQDNQSLIEKLLEKIVESENERFKLDDRISKIENTKKKSIFENNVEKHSEDFYATIFDEDNDDDPCLIHLESPFAPREPLDFSYFNLSESVDMSLSHKLSPFEWIIDDFEEMQNRAAWSGCEQGTFSESFYSHNNGYKLRLCFYPNGVEEDLGKYVTVEFGLIEGEFDNLLRWPMRLTVTVALINQDSGGIYVSKSYNYDTINLKYVFKKPFPGDNHDLYLHGTNRFININALKNNRKLLINRSILIKCIIE